MKMTVKLMMAFLFLGLLIIRPTTSYAWHGHGHTYVDVELGVWPGPYYGYPYYNPYYAPYYVEPYYYAPSYVVSSTSYQPVVLNGMTYYVNNGVYYLYTQYGYQAVPTPAGAPAQQVAAASTVTAAGGPSAIVSSTAAGSEDTVTINIPNSKGGYTAVVLKKSGNGFVGPQGEYYNEFPKVSQLQMMYGK